MCIYPTFNDASNFKCTSSSLLLEDSICWSLFYHLTSCYPGNPLYSLIVVLVIWILPITILTIITMLSILTETLKVWVWLSSRIPASKFRVAPHAVVIGVWIKSLALGILVCIVYLFKFLLVFILRAISFLCDQGPTQSLQTRNFTLTLPTSFFFYLSYAKPSSQLSL